MIVPRGLYERNQSHDGGKPWSYSRRTGRLMCTYKADMDLGFLGIRSIDSPSSEHLIFGRDTREGVVIENDGDPSFLQPLQTLFLQAV